MKRTKKILVYGGLCLLLFIISACTTTNKYTMTSSEKYQNAPSHAKKEQVMIAAAASLETVMKEELIPAFHQQHPNISVEGTYDSSGKLQMQIEKGLAADLFFSAATKQMDALVAQHLVIQKQVVPLLKNQLVFIVPKNSTNKWTSFNDLTKAKMIAIGDPASVPAGQYAEKGLKALGIWEEVTAHASFGTNVTEVLNWVAAGSAEAGLVYATDAATNDQVKIVASLPAAALDQPIIYPVAPLKKTQENPAATAFLTFLQSATARNAFEKAGFTMNK